MSKHLSRFRRCTQLSVPLSYQYVAGRATVTENRYFLLEFPHLDITVRKGHMIRLQ